MTGRRLERTLWASAFVVASGLAVVQLEWMPAVVRVLSFYAIVVGGAVFLIYLAIAVVHSVGDDHGPT